jgi:FtsH-binding integral membrane protein
VLVILLAAVFLRNSTAQAIISPLVLALVLVILIDATMIRRALRRLIAERMPNETTRGLTMYATMRALQIRRFRVPAPRIQPGDKV